MILLKAPYSSLDLCEGTVKTAHINGCSVTSAAKSIARVCAILMNDISAVCSCCVYTRCARSLFVVNIRRHKCATTFHRHISKRALALARRRRYNFIVGRTHTHTHTHTHTRCNATRIWNVLNCWCVVIVVDAVCSALNTPIDEAPRIFVSNWNAVCAFHGYTDRQKKNVCEGH